VIDQGDMRPIESNDHAMADLRRILDAREPFYAQAHATIDTSDANIEKSFQQLLATLSKNCLQPRPD
jgi:XRE family aerobic/anaerobic benzoate catabolism transcriptional regulator